VQYGFVRQLQSLAPPSVTIEIFFEDSEACHLAAPTIRKRRELLEGKLLPFCRSKGYERLPELNVDTLRNVQMTWKFAATSAVNIPADFKTFDSSMSCH
jgi:hypothetical protein